jgi:hypothetical protein
VPPTDTKRMRIETGGKEEREATINVGPTMIGTRRGRTMMTTRPLTGEGPMRERKTEGRDDPRGSTEIANDFVYC